MKSISYYSWLAWWLIALALGGVRAEASGTTTGFALTAFDETNLFFVNTPVTTFIEVSNQSGFTLFNSFLTNTFSGPVTILSITTNGSATEVGATTNPTDNTLIFYFVNFTNAESLTVAFTWQPLTTSPLTNLIVAASSDTDMTNTASTNLVYPVIYAEAADLEVTQAMVSPAALTNDWVITNDWVTYSVTVTNLGPGTVPGVWLTNTLPTGAVLRGVSPAGTSFSTVSNKVIFSVGSLGDGGAAEYQLTIQPTVAGASALVASAGAAGLYDPGFLSQTNHQLFATNYLTANLLVGTNSGQLTDPQNGLKEQTILVSNLGANPVPALRVVATGLTNRLYNASGTNYGYNLNSTNAGSPFVVYPAALAANSQVSLRLQYAPRLPFPFTNGQLQAYAVPASVLNYAPLAASTHSTNLNFSRILKLADGDMLLEFPSRTTNNYTVVYSDNAEFNPAMIALPAIVPSATNTTQWLDYGPPGTVSAPTNSSQRFYRVYLNP